MNSIACGLVPHRPTWRSYSRFVSHPRRLPRGHLMFWSLMIREIAAPMIPRGQPLRLSPLTTRTCKRSCWIRTRAVSCVDQTCPKFAHWNYLNLLWKPSAQPFPEALDNLSQVHINNWGTEKERGNNRGKENLLSRNRSRLGVFYAGSSSAQATWEQLDEHHQSCRVKPVWWDLCSQTIDIIQYIPPK